MNLNYRFITPILLCLLLAACGDDMRVVDSGIGTDSGGSDSGGLDSVGSDTPTTDTPEGDTTVACTHTVVDLQGGWMSTTGLLACFMGTDGWVEDNPSGLMGMSVCSLSADGCTFSCNGGTPNTTFDATVMLDGTDLSLAIVDCTDDPGECMVTYQRDASVTCGP